jgi:predicted nucleic acid-binding protein
MGSAFQVMSHVGRSANSHRRIAAGSRRIRSHRIAQRKSPNRRRATAVSRIGQRNDTVKEVIVLDAGPLGLLCNPNRSDSTDALRSWVDSLRLAGRRIVVPEIADYEIRRELIRNQSRRALAWLNFYGYQLEFVPLQSSTFRLAAELWAQVRNSGLTTAPDSALDCDVLLAALALSLGVPAIIATTNVAHLSRFVTADLWQNIVP